MYGFDIIVNGKNKNGDIQFGNISCFNRMNEKFPDDKVFSETDDYIIVLDGVILNKNEILIKNDKPIWHDVIVDLYEKKGETFFSSLRGSFAGALFDKKKKKWIVFADQLGTKFIYYTCCNGFFCVTEEMGHMYEIMSHNGIKCNLSLEGAYLLLTFGFMVEDKTLCDNVKKIQPGCYLTYEDGVISEKRYYLLNNKEDVTITEADAIEIVDHYFREAVVREFEKDKEYKYKHLVALSAGLDSRMTSFVAHECGYQEQLNFTFSQTNYWDEIIPQKIAEDLKHDWIFKSLDNGLWLLDTDEVTKTMGGNVMYLGSAHSNSMFKLMNFRDFGTIHTGQISGALNGAHVSDPKNRDLPFDVRQAANSVRLYERLGGKITCEYNQELGWYYYRCLNGTNNGSQISFNYSETLSPFMDTDFLGQLMKIPIKYRIRHNLYKKWILSKYPDAAKYVWETMGTTINAPTLRIKNKNIPITMLPSKIWQHAKHVIGMNDDDNRKGMNPIAYYYSHNTDLKDHLNSYKQYIELVGDESLRNDIAFLMEQGDVRERIQAVSLLSAIKLFFS